VGLYSGAGGGLFALAALMIVGLLTNAAFIALLLTVFWLFIELMFVTMLFICWMFVMVIGLSIMTPLLLATAIC
jgi:hypothetical protein